MDHPHYRYSGLPFRAPLTWPDKAPLAISVLLYFEHWELDPSESTFRDPRFKDMNGYFFPDHFLYSLKEYGNRVGTFRVLDLLDQYPFKVTVAANAGACTRYRFLVDEFLRRGYEFAAHGLTATQMITSRMSVAEEQDFIGTSVTSIERCTGKRPTGWVSQDFGQSARTPQLLAEAGLNYMIDWPNDEQPWRTLSSHPFVSIPNPAEWDDVQFMWHRRIAGPSYARTIRTAADRLHADGAESGRLFTLPVHPWVAGTPQRFRYFAESVRHLAELPRTWMATSSDIASHILTSTVP